VANLALVPSNLYPSLTYDDAPAAIEWLCRAFGFEKRLVVPGPDGRIVHSELSLGPGVVMVSSPKPEYGRVGPRSQQGASAALCVQVDDPDGHCARARAAGARILRELHDEDYGARGYMAADPEGHAWYFGTYRPGAFWGAAGASGAGAGVDPVLLKRFESPDEVREMELGRFEIVRLGGLTLGRATYEPGWKWSKHVGPRVGAERCAIEHVGLVLAGRATAAFDDGTVDELRAGAAFHVPARPHDSWVLGDEPYVSLHLLGAEHYAR
jgi:uncharacterized glyoxalase superfamily protein PhnB